jgi:hypothetical protein
MTGDPSTPALDFLVRLRLARRDVKRCIANAKEEAESPAAGNYELGGVVKIPSMPGNKLLHKALTAEGLPADLRAMITAFLSE